MNPYDDNYPIELLCRIEVVRQICETAAHQQNTAISGLPRIGKTFILKFLASSKRGHQFKNEPGRNLDHCIFIYINLEKYLQKSLPVFFETISKDIIKECRGYLKLTLSDETGDARFSDVLDQISEQNFRLVLLLDMFDEFVKNEDIYDILAALRGHATMGEISYITASIDPLHILCRHKIKGSPFHNIFSHKHLEALDSTESNQLISQPAKQADLPFTDTEVKWVLKYSGRHPFFIRHICHILFEENMRTQNGHGEIDFKRVRKQAYNDLLPHFQDIWDHLSDEQRSNVQDEAQQKENSPRELPELSESALFRQFVRNTCNIGLFLMTVDELGDALNKVNDMSALGETNLRLMKTVSERLKRDSIQSNFEKGMAIREVLNEALERLRGPGIQRSSAPEWRFYNILHFHYFRQIQLTNEQIATRLEISVRTYYREREKAFKTLLNILLEMERMVNNNYEE